MLPNSIFIDALTRIQTQFHRQLSDLTPEELIKEPHPPMGWLAWRASRVLDSNFSRLGGYDQQLWIESWAARFGMEPNPTDFGRGATHTREQVAAFRPTVELLLGYHDAVTERGKAYVERLPPAEFDRVLDEPQYDPRPTVAVRLVSLIENGMWMAAQIDYLKGWHRIGGWFPAEMRGGNVRA